LRHAATANVVSENALSQTVLSPHGVSLAVFRCGAGEMAMVSLTARSTTVRARLCCTAWDPEEPMPYILRAEREHTRGRERSCTVAEASLLFMDGSGYNAVSAVSDVLKQIDDGHIQFVDSTPPDTAREMFKTVRMILNERPDLLFDIIKRPEDRKPRRAPPADLYARFEPDEWDDFLLIDFDLRCLSLDSVLSCVQASTDSQQETRSNTVQNANENGRCLGDEEIVQGLMELTKEDFRCSSCKGILAELWHRIERKKNSLTQEEKIIYTPNDNQRDAFKQRVLRARKKDSEIKANGIH
jgi:hypothetical protein